jgi:TRAP-type mannitol/chloroaromatic compound transport system permease large subunit
MLIRIEDRPATSRQARVREILDVAGRVQRNPYGMVGGALAIGFVLGGGLFTRLSGRIAGAGLRMGLMAALPLLKQELFEKRETDR